VASKVARTPEEKEKLMNQIESMVMSRKIPALHICKELGVGVSSYYEWSRLKRRRLSRAEWSKGERDGKEVQND
jgi:hypothetical protein